MQSKEPETIVITFGTFSLFHIGHLKILERARTYGQKLIVGVSSDEFNFIKKKAYPVFTQNERMEIVKALKYVDDVFLEESMEKKAEYINQHQANILIMGDDWKDKFDYLLETCPTLQKVIYLPRTPHISSSGIELFIRGIIHERDISI